jgi:probable rRNA maturation factor
MEVDVQYALEEDEECIRDIPSPNLILRWVGAALSGERPDAELTVRIVGLEEGSHLNESYRHKPGPTNVLSFPAELPPDVNVPLLGDLVICAPVVVREAAEQGKQLEAHWCHMVIHGTLHLLGHDHIGDDEARRMEARERCVLSGLGYPDPYEGDFSLKNTGVLQ